MNRDEFNKMVCLMDVHPCEFCKQGDDLCDDNFEISDKAWLMYSKQNVCDRQYAALFEENMNLVIAIENACKELETRDVHLFGKVKNMKTRTSEEWKDFLLGKKEK